MPLFMPLSVTPLMLRMAMSGHADSSDSITAANRNGDTAVAHTISDWEYLDSHIAVEFNSNVEAIERASPCPLGTRPGLLGFGQCITKHTPALKNGSHSGKGW